MHSTHVLCCFHHCLCHAPLGDILTLLYDNVYAEIEDVIGHTDTKIISDANLPYLVRQMAVHANVSMLHFCSVVVIFHSAVCYTSMPITLTTEPQLLSSS